MEASGEEVKDIFQTISKRDIPAFKKQDGTLDVKRMLEVVGLKRKDIAGLFSVGVDSIRFDEKIPQEQVNFYFQLLSLCEHVADFFDGDIHKLETWFLIDNPELGFISPRNLIRKGRLAKLIDIVLANKSSD